MTSAVAGRSLDFGSEDYDAVERAVMETPRGRWFLAQRDQRLRMAETQGILDALKQLKMALAAIPVQPAPANGADIPRTIAPPGSSAAETAAQALSMKNLKYFKQDEAVFSPAEPAASKLSAVAAAKPAEVIQPAEAPAVARGARLIVNRISPAAAQVPAAQVKPAESETLSPPTAESSDKRRIVIIRRAATEAMDIPLQAELAAAPAF